jgi:TonB family protein
MDQEQMQIFNVPAPKSTPEKELYAVTLFPLPPRPALRSTLPETGAILPMTANLRPTILFRQKPRYTDEARNEGVEGTVILEVTFHVNGTITGIRVVRGLPHGLTECAIEVAQEIRFNPAVKNGAPVSVRGTLEYTFKL